MSIRVALSLVMLSAGVAAADVRTVRPPAFQAIEIAGTLPLEVTVGPAAGIEIRGDADKIADITAEVKAGTLVLGNKTKRSQRAGELRVLVTTPTLAALRVSGTGSVEVHKLAGPRLDVDVSGSGSIALDGAVQNLGFTVSGTGSIRAKRLRATAVDIDVSGTAAIELGGNPKVTKRITGTAAIN